MKDCWSVMEIPTFRIEERNLKSKERLQELNLFHFELMKKQKNFTILPL